MRSGKSLLMRGGSGTNWIVASMPQFYQQLNTLGIRFYYRNSHAGSYQLE